MVTASVPTGSWRELLVLIDVGHRERMQRLHQQGPQTRHRQG
jgi:hypothetical protein